MSGDSGIRGQRTGLQPKRSGRGEILFGNAYADAACQTVSDHKNGLDFP